MRRQDIANLPNGGDRRSIGRSNALQQPGLRQAKRFAELLKRLSDEDPIVRMRAADAAEKIIAD